MNTNMKHEIEHEHERASEQSMSPTSCQLDWVRRFDVKVNALSMLQKEKTLLKPKSEELG